MGGGSYSGDVAVRSRSTREEIFDRHEYIHKDPKSERRVCHADMDVKGKIRECCDSTEHPTTTPIGIAIDGSRSRGEDAKVVYNKMPVLIGQIIMHKLCLHPALNFTVIGDASDGDAAPIQMSQFEADNRIDSVFKTMWLEGQGGGSGQESYELAAYAYLKHTRLDATKRGKKGLLFLLGDESPYPFVYRDQAKVWLGDDLPADIPTVDVFRDLQRLYHVFFFYQNKSWEALRKDIDAEMKARVEGAGGMYENVDIRASLMWNNRNDLDLHIMTPGGFHIFYAQKRAPCGGFLDVDMNVTGETTKPVENIRWEKSKAPEGHYQVSVQCYATHGGNAAATPFRVEVEVAGNKILHFDGTTPKGVTGPESNTAVYEFDFVRRQAEQKKTKQEVYAAYKPEVILGNWRKLLPAQNIITLEDPKATVDMLRGVIAVMHQYPLEKYIHDLQVMGQTEDRQRQVQQGLTPLVRALAGKTVNLGGLPGGPQSGRQSGGRTTRL